MPRYRRPPLTASDLEQHGPPVRIRDLVALTGLSSPTILADIACGVLHAARRCDKPNSPYFIVRAEAQRYVRTLGYSDGRRAS